MRYHVTHLIALITSLNLSLLSCNKSIDPTDALRPLTVHFTFLPENNHTDITIADDLITVIRTSPLDSILSKRSRKLTTSELVTIKDIKKAFSEIPPKTYEKKGVLDGVTILIAQGKRTITCKNCLNDYILAATGKKGVYQDRATERLRELIVTVNNLAAFDELKERPPRNRVVVVADMSRIRKPGEKFNVIFVDQKKEFISPTPHDSLKPSHPIIPTKKLP